MFHERDRRCAAVQLMLSTNPSYDNRTIASTLKMQIWIATNNRDVPRVMKTKFPATVMVFGVVSSEGHIMPPHIFEVGLKVNTKVYLDVLKSVVILWCNQVAGGRPWVWQQDLAPAHKSKETQAWLQKEWYDFVPFSHWSTPLPRPKPAGLLHLVIRREHHQHDHNSILVADYLTKMGINTVSQPPYSLDLAPCDIWLFPKFRSCRYETIEEMKEAVTKVIDTLTQENFDGTFQRFLERYNKCIAVGGDYFEGDYSFMCVLSTKVPIRKKSGNLFNDPRIYNEICIYIYIYINFIHTYI